MVSAAVVCSARVFATVRRSAPRAAAAALPASLRAPVRRQAARRPISTSIVAQSLERRVQTEGTGPSPKQGDKASDGLGLTGVRPIGRGDSQQARWFTGGGR